MNELTVFEIGGGQVRVTPDGQRVAAFDLIRLACGVSQPKGTWRRLSANYPEVVSICTHLVFPGAGQRPTPTVDADGWVRLSMLLPGHKAAAWRAQYAELVTRYLRGDRSLADEVHERADAIEGTSRVEIVPSVPVSPDGGASSLEAILAPLVSALTLLTQQHNATLQMVSRLEERFLRTEHAPMSVSVAEPSPMLAPPTKLVSEPAPLTLTPSFFVPSRRVARRWAEDMASEFGCSIKQLWAMGRLVGMKQYEVYRANRPHVGCRWRIRGELVTRIKNYHARYGVPGEVNN